MSAAMRALVDRQLLAQPATPPATPNPTAEEAS